MISQGKHWDIFCKIVDNFGDIGVCWRLSQQLANEHAIQVRLIIDDIHVAQKIIAQLDISKPLQVINNIEIVAWSYIEASLANQTSSANQTSVANQINKPFVDVVIETFACTLPESYLNRMHSHTLWINLEYLSAEAWVGDFHAKPSKHPSLNLTKYYFFPGFFENTGGLIRENDLIQNRDAFINSIESQSDFWQRIDIGQISKEVLKISLFCYPQAQIKTLLKSLSETKKKISLFVPFNSAIAEVTSLYMDFEPKIGNIYYKENLTIYVLPFLSQVDYDRLLWACDLNFVRGEDSWIRAIWAGKPFIWQPYIQTDDTHLKKLNAFLDLYTFDADPESKALINEAHLTWSGYASHAKTQLDQAYNQDCNIAEKNIWLEFIGALENLHQHSNEQTNLLNLQSDLATKLVIFSENLQKNQV